MEDQISFTPLLIISGLAFVVPFVASRIRSGLIPMVVVEILAGIAFGRTGLGLIESSVWLDFMSQFGFAFLMFLSGLEIDFGLFPARNSARSSTNRRLLDNPLILGLAVFSLTLIGAGIGAFWLLGNSPWTHVMLMGLILSTTSVGIVVPILKEGGLTRSPYGQSIMMAAMVADFLTIFLITVLAAILASENVLQVTLIAVLFAVFFFAVRVGGRLRLHGVVQKTLEELAHATAQVQVRGALALMLVFVVLAEAVQAELVLGAFLAGAVMSSLSREEGSVLRSKLDAIGYGFFVPIFFITVGAEFDFAAIGGSSSSLTTIPIIILIAFAVKLVPSLLFAARYSMRQAIAAGFLLSSRLSLIIAASVIGLRLGVIDEATNSAMILVAVVTSTASPAVFNRLFRKPNVQKRRVVIVGGGDVGRLLAHRLVADQLNPVLIEHNIQRVAECREEGLNVVSGSGVNPDVLAEAAGDGIDTFIAVTPDDDINLNACRLAHGMYNVDYMLARANSHSRMEQFRAAGIKPVSRGMALAITLQNLVIRPDLFDLISEPESDSSIVEVTLGSREFAGTAVQNIFLPGDVIILLVHRGDVSFVPHPSTVLEMEDLIVIAGDRDLVQDAANLLADEDPLTPQPRD